jgi:hypothetical protein
VPPPSNAPLVATAIFTTLLGLVSGTDALSAVTCELAALMALLSIAHALAAELNPIDRTARVTLAVVLGMLLVGQVMLWMRGEPRPIFTGFFRSLTRFGLVSFLLSWTAMISASRSPGQFLYNLVFVGSFTSWLGHISTSLVLGLATVGTTTWLAAGLEGAALGAAFAHVTMNSEQPGGTNS